MPCSHGIKKPGLDLQNHCLERVQVLAFCKVSDLKHSKVTWFLPSEKTALNSLIQALESQGTSHPGSL